MVQGENKILLHACCAICSGYPINLLRELGYDLTVYFCNDNIDTKDEYEKRLASQVKLCEKFGVKLFAEKYKHDDFLNYVNGYEAEPEKGKRCNLCIKMRLKKTVQKAIELGINKITTSLVISPHKNFEMISDIGKSIAKENNIYYLPINFRKNDGFLKTNLISRELGLYRQNYCGCEFAKEHLLKK